MKQICISKLNQNQHHQKPKKCYLYHISYQYQYNTITQLKIIIQIYSNLNKSNINIQKVYTKKLLSLVLSPTKLFGLQQQQNYQYFENTNVNVILLHNSKLLFIYMYIHCIYIQCIFKYQYPKCQYNNITKFSTLHFKAIWIINTSKNLTFSVMTFFRNFQFTILYITQQQTKLPIKIFCNHINSIQINIKNQSLDILKNIRKFKQVVFIPKKKKSSNLNQRKYVGNPIQNSTFIIQCKYIKFSTVFQPGTDPTANTENPRQYEPRYPTLTNPNENFCLDC
eukprot:TRINITY_DN31108_c0_g2_i5.p1 TRINITY_DN31108_c0_g2~~TRINITY_DN31108_c0_g2_i5.p1  ORF type:complete len:281 (+),score=-29.74 TRINITY_DN31108_c0_g2_i5:292-1134(+)